MTIRALEETNILYLNKEMFIQQVEPSDMKVISDIIQPLDVEKIAMSIMNIRNNTRLKVITIN